MESLPGKRLPPSVRIGESWELVDREEAQSVVHEGPFRGWMLHDLWCQRRAEIFGPGLANTPRFPLLCKILDAQERLSERLEARPKRAAVREQQRCVDRDHALGALDQVGVDEQPGLAGAVGVHDGSHACSVGRESPGANTDPV